MLVTGALQRPADVPPAASRCRGAGQDHAKTVALYANSESGPSLLLIACSASSITLPYLVLHYLTKYGRLLPTGNEMPGQGNERPQERAPLSRERVLRGALAVADASGI